MTACRLGSVIVRKAGGVGRGGSKLTKDALGVCVVDIWLVAKDGVRMSTVLLTIAEALGADDSIPDRPLMRTTFEDGALAAEILAALNTEGCLMVCTNPDGAAGTIGAVDSSMYDAGKIGAVDSSMYDAGTIGAVDNSMYDAGTIGAVDSSMYDAGTIGAVDSFMYDAGTIGAVDSFMNDDIGTYNITRFY